MATFWVMNLDDSGTGSLRQAMIDAAAYPGAQTIKFGATGTITLQAQLPYVTTTLTIEGPGAARLTVSGDRRHRIFHVGEPGNLTIQGLTLAAGTGDHETPRRGGAILNQGTVSVIGSVIQDCFGAEAGAIYHLGAGVLEVVACVLQDNHTALGGGAINNWGTATVRDSVFSRNDASSGGAIQSLGVLTLTGSAFSENHGRMGGAVNAAGTVTVSDCTFTGNTAVEYGGGILHSGVIVVIKRSALVGNSARRGGGLMALTQAVLTNVTLSGNQATAGAAIYSGGPVDLSFVTVADSTVTNPSGGALETNGSGRLRLRNTLVANTTDDAGAPRPNCVGGVSCLGGSFSTDAGCPACTVVTPAALALGPLALNPPGAKPTHALLPGSVAIDAAAGCVSQGGAAFLVDQRGVARPQGPGCDSGAFEAVPSPPRPKTPKYAWPRWLVPPDCGRIRCPSCRGD